MTLFRLTALATLSRSKGPGVFLNACKVGRTVLSLEPGNASLLSSNSATCTAPRITETLADVEGERQRAVRGANPSRGGRYRPNRRSGPSKLIRSILEEFLLERGLQIGEIRHGRALGVRIRETHGGAD
jgi:hypothetical protein